MNSPHSEPALGPRPEQNAEFIKNLFSSISGTYDRANDVITFGMARAWRRELVRWSGAISGDHVLDCATGTGDLALEFKRTVGGSGRVLGTDFCADMLKTAPAKALRLGLDVKFEVADATALTYQDAQFDVTSIAYGIRNVDNVEKAIHEMARVTKSGGRLMILETGEVSNPILRTGIRFYFKNIVPRLGGWVSGRPEAYQYLQKTSGVFPSGAAFNAILLKTGLFTSVDHRALMGGASFMYRATRR